MVAGWVAFFALIAFSEPALRELWHDLRALPLVIQGVVTVVLFPFVLALSVWESSWPEAARLAFVATCAVAWSAAFVPRPRKEGNR